MAQHVRVGTVRPGQGRPQQTYQGTYSGYGATKGESVGYDPRNPYAYMGTQVKAYPGKASVEAKK